MNASRVLLAVFLASAAAPLAGGAGLPTIDEALRISKESGRPILALAGQAT